MRASLPQLVMLALLPAATGCRTQPDVVLITIDTLRVDHVLDFQAASLRFDPKPALGGEWLGVDLWSLLTPQPTTK